MSDRPQFVISFSLEQVSDIAEAAEMSIETTGDLKQALKKLIPNLRDGNKAGRKKSVETAK